MSDPVWRTLAALILSAWVVALAQARTLVDSLSVGPVAFAGGLMAVTGLVTVGLGGGGRRLGGLTLIAGSMWFGSALLPGLGGEVWPRALLAGADVLALPMTLMVCWIPTATSAVRPLRHWIQVVLASAGVVSLVTIAAWNPFYAPATSCVVECWDVASLVALGPGGRAAIRFLTVGLAAAAGAGLLAIGWVVLRDPARRASLAGLATALGGVILGGAAIMSSVAGVARLWSIPGREALDLASHRYLIQTIGAVGILLITLGIIAWAMRAARVRGRLQRLGAEIDAAPAPGSFAAALANALDDPALQVGFANAAGDAYVGSHGEPFALPISGERVATVIERDGRPVAVVIHRSELLSKDLLRELRTGLLVALDNERLTAVRLALVEALRASRSRIVEISDAERRRIERDLHDGVQQQLLAVTIQLRLAKAAAQQRGDEHVADRLRSAELAARTASDGLRRVARGIFPGALANAGLLPALGSMAYEAAVPLEIEGSLPLRPPLDTAIAAYEIVARWLGAAVAGGASRAVVRVSSSDESLVLELSEGPVPDKSEWLDRVEDRADAAGGVIRLSATTAGGTLVRVELPCV